MLNERHFELVQNINKTIAKYENNNVIRKSVVDYLQKHNIPASYGTKILDGKSSLLDNSSNNLDDKLDEESREKLHNEYLYRLYSFTMGLRNGLMESDGVTGNRIGTLEDLSKINVDYYFEKSEIKLFNKYNSQKNKNQNAETKRRSYNHKQKIAQNGKVAYADRYFIVDKEIKESFLSSLAEGTQNTVKGLLFKADDYEIKMHKSIYHFNSEEIDDFLESSFTNKSITSIRSTISYYAKYIYYCNSIGITGNQENKFEEITDAKKYVSKTAMKSKYIVYEQLQAIIRQLVNDCDKLLVLLLFMGVKPSEISNLRADKIDFAERTMALEEDDESERAIINLDDQTLDLLKKTIEQRTYLLNNGTNRSRRRKDLEVGKGLGERSFEFPQSCYVFKTAMSEIPDTKIRKNVVAERIRIIREWCGLNYLTPTSLNQSGIINYAWKLQQAKGSELDRNDYILICETFRFTKRKYDKNGNIVYGSSIWKLKETIQDGFRYLNLH